MYLFPVFLPLISFFIFIFLSNFINKKILVYISTFNIFLATFISFLLIKDVVNTNYTFEIYLFHWLSSGNLISNWTINIDFLTSTMILIVNLISALVQFYSIGYMREDKSIARFFCYLNLFSFFMLILVSSGNLLQLYFGWEGVGLCSYLLISFWFYKKSASNASLKAFIVNRVGDMFFILGIILIYLTFNSITFTNIFSNLNDYEGIKYNFLFFDVDVINIICLFLILGAMGKSAQIGFHTWLPDAMEGPTPVSALIHAATMVTAGVFLVVRCSPIFEYSQLTLNIITVVGMSTAFFAATVALVQNDIKKIIAYSTCSQLGYMFFAAGVGAYNVAMFHLFTHAFFKALLFLGSGSVIHSFKDEQNINQMGGIWKKLPYTWVLMIIGTLALTGFPFLSGFYSKDAIIEYAYLRGNTAGYYAVVVGIFTALLTSIYSWRLIFKTFHGTYNNKKLKINTMHESPFVMLTPLIILAIGAIFAGYFFKELFIGHSSSNYFWTDSIKFLLPLSLDHPPLWIIYITPIIVILSIPLSYYLFVKNKNITNWLANENQPLYNFLLNKWYFDELYDFLFVKPFKKIGIFFWKNVDIKIIDKFGPDGISNLIKIFSNKAVKFQSGFVYQYAFIMLLGFSALLTYLIII